MSHFMFVTLFFQPLAMTPLTLAFMRQAAQCLFVALVFPPLTVADFFPLMLKPLLFQPLAVPPLPFAFSFVPSQGLFASLIGLVPPMSKFPLLKVAFFLPHPFVVSAVEMIVGVSRFMLGTMRSFPRSCFRNVGVAAQLEQAD